MHALHYVLLALPAMCTRPAMPAGDTKGIDDVIERVQLIVEPVETVMFDLFDQAHAPQWRALRARFFADNEEVKAATRELIDTSFRKLRSAEGAFELFQVCGEQCGCVAQVTMHCMFVHYQLAREAAASGFSALKCLSVFSGFAPPLVVAELQEHQKSRSHTATDDEQAGGYVGAVSARDHCSPGDV